MKSNSIVLPAAIAVLLVAGLAQQAHANRLDALLLPDKNRSGTEFVCLDTCKRTQRHDNRHLWIPVPIAVGGTWRHDERSRGLCAAQESEISTSIRRKCRSTRRGRALRPCLSPLLPCARWRRTCFQGHPLCRRRTALCRFPVPAPSLSPVLATVGSGCKR